MQEQEEIIITPEEQEWIDRTIQPFNQEGIKRYQWLPSQRDYQNRLRVYLLQDGQPIDEYFVLPQEDENPLLSFKTKLLFRDSWNKAGKEKNTVNIEEAKIILLKDLEHLV